MTLYTVTIQNYNGMMFGANPVVQGIGPALLFPYSEK